MKTYYIEQPDDPKRAHALSVLLAGLKEFYMVECREVVAITTDLPSLDSLLSGIAARAIEEPEEEEPTIGMALPPGIRSSKKVEPEPKPAKTVGPGVQIITDSVERQIKTHGAIGGRRL